MGLSSVSACEPRVGGGAVGPSCECTSTECRRFDSYVVKGPGPEDFDFFSSAIGKDGYGGFIIYCGCGICVRPANNCGFLPSWMRRAGQVPVRGARHD